MSEAGFASENQASQLFHQGHYHEALKLYTAIYEHLPTQSSSKIKVNILLNRSACHLKLKQFQNVLEDCNEVLALEADNVKALGRKTKVLCSLGQFTDAYQVSQLWKEKDPLNEQATKECELLHMILKTLPDQDGDASIETPVAMSTWQDKYGEDQRDIAQPTSVESDRKTEGMLETEIQLGCDDVNSFDSSLTEASDVESGEDNHELRQNSISLPKQTDSPTEVNQDLEIKLNVHCEGKMTQGGAERWNFRPPPRGLTDKEYSLCAKFTALGCCPFGAQCSHAHSVDELAEWCQRFAAKKNDLKRAQEELTHSTYKQAEALLEKLMAVENPATLMKENIDGINVHMNSEQKIHLTSKKASHSWMFTLTTRMSLKHVILLDDTNRKHFHISSITVGPKRQQKMQDVEPDYQEWTNPNYTEGKSMNEKVYRVKVLFRTEIYGTFRQSVVFDFGEEFILLRELCVDSVPTVDIQALKENLIVQEGGRWDFTKINVVQFDPFPMPHDEKEKDMLEEYPAPLATQFIASQTLLHPSLTQDNYKERMHCLLEVEEMAWFSSIAKFNVKTTLKLVDRFMLMPSTHSAAKFARKGELYAYMKLCGTLSEDTGHGRLILQNVNTLYLAPVQHKNTNQSNGTDGDDHIGNKQPDKVYEAVIEEKGKNFIYIRLSIQCVSELDLKKDSEIVVEVQFHLNRLPVCQMHRAVDKIKSMDVVFPLLEPQMSIPWTPQKLWKDNLDPRLNAKQIEAIVAITTDVNIKLPPVLIVGPYGTGKTFTLAQATKEVLKQENTRILICTHSNSAADLYIKDYLHSYVESNHPEAVLLRLYYRHRWIQTVHPTVKQYCLIGPTEQKNGMSNGSSVFRHPTLEDLEKVRVVVTTFSTSQYLFHDSMAPDFFTHIFLDEAAQAMECESLIPLNLAGPNTRIVLAGDHMQLGPEVHSEFARERDFHISLLERLYERYPNQHPCKILLCENYRSHHAIINFTSELFYDSKLVASSNQTTHDVFYPLTFFTARGEEVQHQNSTSFYNNAEVYEVVERVGEIVKTWPEAWGDLDESSIGVVSPYSDQVQHIRSELRKRKLFNISVERVLNIQGKQFRVILLSTVRTRHTCSADPSLEDELDYGFLSNVKLLNTAITRAQSLVAVVGDPVSLSSIGRCRKIWERFLEICKDKNSLYGISWDHLRAELDGVELKKIYVLNPLAPEFIPNRLRHGPIAPPEPIAYGKYGYMFTTRQQPLVAPSAGYSSSHWSQATIQQAYLQPMVDKALPTYSPVNSVGYVPGYTIKPPSLPKHSTSTVTLSPNKCPSGGMSPTVASNETSRGHTRPGSSWSPETPASSLSSGSNSVASPPIQSVSEVTGTSVQGRISANVRTPTLTGQPVYMAHACAGSPFFLPQSPVLPDPRSFSAIAQQQTMLHMSVPYLPHHFVKQRPVPLHSAGYAGAPLFNVASQAVGPLYQIGAGQPAPYGCPVIAPSTSQRHLSRPLKEHEAYSLQGCNLRYQNHRSTPANVMTHLGSSQSPLSVNKSEGTTSPSITSSSEKGTVKQPEKVDSDEPHLDALLSGTGTSFFRKLWLSRELYEYIEQTEGKAAANDFIHRFQQTDFCSEAKPVSMPALTSCSDIDIEDSSIIAISRIPTNTKAGSGSDGCESSLQDNSTESQSPLLTRLKQQQQQLIESTYKLTVSQAHQFTGPYSMLKKINDPIDKNDENDAGETTNANDMRSPSSDKSSSSDPLEETCQVADSIVRFLEDGLDDQLLKSESSLSTSVINSAAEHSRPLYLRGSRNISSSDLPNTTSGIHPPTYASVLQKSPTPKSDTPCIHSDSKLLTGSTHTYGDLYNRYRAKSCDPAPRALNTSIPPSDPLDILRNLNIKASPSTQALFDYFA